MSERGKIRIQLNIATAALVVAAFSLFTMTCFAQVEAVKEAAKNLAGLDPTELLAVIALLSLGLCGYLIRMLFGKLLVALDKFTDSNARMSSLLEQRPCIRDPKND
jgi:hypothetical protein